MDDLKFLFARAAARERVAAAVRASLRLFGGVRDAGDAGNDGHIDLGGRLYRTTKLTKIEKRAHAFWS